MSSESDSLSPGYPTQPQFPPGSYPPGYAPWMVPPPSAPGPWGHPWPGASFPVPQIPGPQQWVPATTVEATSSSDNQGDQYMVDSLRRIYSNEDSSIEIERVKVQRRQQPPHPLGPPMITFPGFSQGYPAATDTSNCRSVVPVAGPQALPERRPPPRKHRKNRLNNELVPVQHMNPHPYSQHYPHPYMPYMPYPYPYPYPYFNYAWPPTSQTIPTWSHADTKKNNGRPCTSQHRSLPASPDSQRLDSGTTRSIRDSLTPESGRPLSPNASSQVSQITESQATDIAPSDSVSVGGYCKNKSAVGQTPEWMLEMQKNLANIDDSSEVGDRSSFTTAPSDLPSPPSRRNTLNRQSSDTKNVDLSNDDFRSNASELNNASNKLDTSADCIKNNTICAAEEQFSKNAHLQESSKKTSEGEAVFADADGRSSTTSFHSTRNTSDIVLAETDSTDIFLATDTATADEEAPTSRKPPLPPIHREDGVSSPPCEDSEDSHRWVMQGKGEAPDVALQQGTNSWLADVSLWRARLVVSLDKGQGLDQQDWATFHLLIQHPLPLHLKLSLLHAPRICAANANTGAVQVRAALLQLARHAQVLLQKEEERPPSWKTITAHNSQPWKPVKGGIEILRILGYRSREDETLKYSKRLSLEASLLARLTLDLLVFADELRLYLTGGHSLPRNVSDLFCPVTFSSTVSPEPLGMQMDLENPSSFFSSADFLSAESTPVVERKVSDKSHAEVSNDNDSVSQSIGIDYNRQLLNHQSSSEEEVTLHEDDHKERSKTHHLTVPQKANDIDKNDNQRMSVASSTGFHSSATSDRMSLSTDITSLPDLQSMSSLPPSRLSNVPRSEKQSDCCNLNTPIASPMPPSDESTSPKVPNLGKKEDHVYEEIGEIRAQVQKLRSSVSVPNFPPPIPPKSRASYQDDENSVLYSRSDWSAASSIGGSMGPRRKKRRAPLPPSFLYEEQIKRAQNLLETSLESVEITDSLSTTENVKTKNDVIPFYEEIGEKRVKQLPLEEKMREESKPSNPFYEAKPKPSGYVGANPFYEDLSRTKSKVTPQIYQTESFSDENTTSILSTSFELQFDHSDGNTPPVAAARPKRRAPRPPKITKIPDQRKNVENSTIIVDTPNEEISQPIDSNTSPSSKEPRAVDHSSPCLPKNPSESELYDVDLNSIHEESATAPPVITSVIRKSNAPPKNVNQKQHQDSQDVVSVDQIIAESKENISNDSSDVQETAHTLDKNIVSKGSDTNNTTSNLTPCLPSKEVQNNKIELKIDLEEKQQKSDELHVSYNAIAVRNDLHIVKNADAGINDMKSGVNNVDAKINTKDVFINSDVKESSIGTDAVTVDSGTATALTEDKLPKNDSVQIIRCNENVTNLDTLDNDDHSTVSLEKNENTNKNCIDNVDETRELSLKKDNIICNTNNSSSMHETSEEKPPAVPPKAVLHIIEDIPYIDNSDVRNYKYATVQAKRTSATLKRTTISPIAFLHQSLPFMDDNVEFPFPPPPPPPVGSPPSSPNMSAPETPHTSPPQTPPLMNFDDDSLSEQQLQNRLSKISEGGEMDDNKESKTNDPDELTSPIIFSNSGAPTENDVRKLSTYYEIPEVADIPPPLPAKPNNLRNVSGLQKTPEIPPKSPTLKTQKNKTCSSGNDDDRYEIPDVAIANALAAHAKASTNDLSGDARFSASSNLELTSDDTSNPSKPTRRRYYSSSLDTPPRPPKNPSTGNRGLQSGSSFSSLPAGKASTLPSAAARNSSPSRPVSTPSSPRPVMQKRLKRNASDKSRKSWPFLFCDCLYANYETNNSNKKKPLL